MNAKQLGERTTKQDDEDRGIKQDKPRKSLYRNLGVSVGTNPPPVDIDLDNLFGEEMI